MLEVPRRPRPPSLAPTAPAWSATWLRQAGADLADIQDLCGHTDTATTRIYAVPKLAKQHEAIQRLRLVRSG